MRGTRVNRIDAVEFRQSTSWIPHCLEISGTRVARVPGLVDVLIPAA